ncbi:polysaccharide biosynthesis/export family protein [Flavobacterium sp. SUN046]|uniref:polysaccharide biosynthesis/export family protein n=1 Tax=Flavobacterium sp. SUN046 TaxID=3002440 RepID=UPI002DBCBF5F|nr:polysaccharide biosynthesis/export family protein [Flavobacterium sp. SUN046]MEC4050895.1 polysaccharide biosynthesis/export family protein [Flavobacterium sp. SUN046]
MKKIKVLVFIVSLILFTSCVSRKKMVYFQESEQVGGSDNSKGNVANFEPVIQNDDMLFIQVSDLEADAVTHFNLQSSQSVTDAAGINAGSNNTYAAQKQTYLVDNIGNIDFPVLGSISVGNLSVTKVKELLREKLTVYLKNPIVNVRIVNFKVSVLGEVNKPGTVSIVSQRVTLPEALAMSGDLTIYARRDNVLLIRDVQGVKTYNRIDLTNSNIVDSPFYYLDQNDVIYVEPRKVKLNSTAISSNITTVISIVSFLITTTLILTK